MQILSVIAGVLVYLKEAKSTFLGALVLLIKPYVCVMEPNTKTKWMDFFWLILFFIVSWLLFLH